jgi:hypothetical protein
VEPTAVTCLNVCANHLTLFVVLTYGLEPFFPGISLQVIDQIRCPSLHALPFRNLKLSPVRGMNILDLRQVLPLQMLELLLVPTVLQILFLSVVRRSLKNLLHRDVNICIRAYIILLSELRIRRLNRLLLK